VIRSSRFFVSTVAAVVATVALSACSSGNASVSSAIAKTPTSTSGTLNIGAVLPLTGASGTIGEDQRRGIELAVAKVNTDGGVNGQKLNVIVEDSQGQAASALDATRKLTSINKVPVVLGEYSSGITIPMGQYLQQQKIVHINIGSSSPDVAKIGDMSFSTIGLDTIASSFSAKTLTALGHKKAAILVPNNSYGTGVSKTFKAAFEADQGSITETVLYTEGQSDYRAELNRIKSSGADVVLYSAYGKESATINNQAFELGMTKKTPWFAVYLSMCTTDSNPKVVEGQLGMDVNYIGPDGQAYASAYKAKFGKDFATTFSGYAYDAVLMVVDAIKRANSSTPTSIAAALHSGGPYTGVTGEIAFDNSGQRKDQPYLVLKYSAGKLVPVTS
jgi:branched-chain amino acid transport system substrate-binding protein